MDIDFLINFSWGVVIGGIIMGIIVNFIWKFVRDKLRQRAIAIALAIELSYVAREAKEVRDAIKENFYALPHHSLPNSLFNKLLIEVPELLNHYKILPDLIEVYNRIEDVAEMSLEFNNLMIKNKVISKDDWHIYTVFIDWIIVQSEELICRLEIIAYGYSRTPFERYSSMPKDLRKKAEEICKSIDLGLKKLENSKE